MKYERVDKDSVIEEIKEIISSVDNDFTNSKYVSKFFFKPFKPRAATLIAPRHFTPGAFDQHRQCGHADAAHADEMRFARRHQ